MYSNDRLIILDADGTTLDAFDAIARTFARHGMAIGELERFQKRRNLFKYLGGLKEFPSNLKKQLGREKRSRLIATLTEVYREEGRLFPGIADLMQILIDAPRVRVGLVTRNITNQPVETLQQVYRRHGVDLSGLDFLVHIPLSQTKSAAFRHARERFAVNPGRAAICGDEGKDFVAAVHCGMHPFMVSYGFEDYERLTQKAGVPSEILSRSPEELCQRILHAFDLSQPEAAAAGQPQNPATGLS
jgi:phosphoglycolate phosphatase